MVSPLPSRLFSSAPLTSFFVQKQNISSLDDDSSHFTTNEDIKIERRICLLQTFHKQKGGKENCLKNGRREIELELVFVEIH